jgi:hypothetical protein
VLHGSVCGRKNNLYVGEEGSAGRREVRAVLSVAKQCKTNLPLQLFDLKAERLRFHMQARCGSAEVQFISDYPKVAQVAKFHGSDRGGPCNDTQPACFERIGVLAHEGCQPRALRRISRRRELRSMSQQLVN